MNATNNAARRVSTGELRLCENSEEVAVAAADLFIELCAQAIAGRGRFRVALSGGSTPKHSYELLAGQARSSRVDWQKTDIFWGDERNVSADDPQSNYRMTREALLDHVPVPPTNVHRVRTETESPSAAAEAYADEIRSVFGIKTGVPSFDLVLLGLGTNGHTASLFPYSPALNEHERLVAADFVEEVKMWRITMTAPLINAAHTIAFLVSGADKAQVLSEVLSGPKDVQRLPAQLIEPRKGNLLWVVDRPAARLIL